MSIGALKNSFSLYSISPPMGGLGKLSCQLQILHTILKIIQYELAKNMMIS